jgi:hypothetical protein
MQAPKVKIRMGPPLEILTQVSRTASPRRHVLATTHDKDFRPLHRADGRELVKATGALDGRADIASETWSGQSGAGASSREPFGNLANLSCVSRLMSADEREPVIRRRGAEHRVRHRKGAQR